MIVLTGGTGFLGSQLLRALVESGETVTLLKRSFSDTTRIGDLLGRIDSIDIDRSPVEPAFEGGEVTAVIHCATDYGRRNRDPYQIIDANIVLPLRLLHLASCSGTGRFINTDTILDKRISHYSLSKSQFAQWLETYGEKLLCLNVSLDHFFGPGDDPSKFTSSVIRSLIRGDAEIPLTPGEQRRHFIYVADVVEALLDVLHHRGFGARGFRQLQVGSRDGVPVREFVERAKAISGNTSTTLKFGALPYRENEVMNPQIDLAPILATGWRPRTSLDDALARTIDAERRSTVPCAP